MFLINLITWDEIDDILYITGYGGKPTPLGVGWIALV